MGQTVPNSLNLPFIEGLYADYVRAPDSVTPEWRAYFESMEDGSRGKATPRFEPTFRPPSLFNPLRAGDGLQRRPPDGEETQRGPFDETMTRMQDRVDQLIRGA